MSSIPCLFGEFIPTNNNLYGMGLYPGNYYSSLIPSEQALLHSMFAPLGRLQSYLKHLSDIENRMHIGKDGFEVNLDVQHFKPEEIQLKTVDNTIIIEAKHEEKQDSDSSYISRHFVRRYNLPDGFKPDDVISTLSSDGVLTVKCAKSEAIKDAKVREIQIQPTGPVRSTQKDQSDKNEEREAIKEKPKETTEEKVEEEKK